MEATCNNCNHWDTNSTAAQQDNFGECDVLSTTGTTGMQYVLPVIQSSTPAGAEMITSGDFGCNQFAAA